MTDSIKIISFETDPGHGWLVAPIAEIREAGLSITDFSFINRDTGMVYLEEDCDATTYINHLNENKIAFTFSETHTNDSHPARSYERWPQHWNN
tara:strand:+ start:1853 stop:2134 length:282 start_codon:yes stop_codon:yes gene_type:complete